MGGDWMIQGEGISIPILGFAMDPQQLISLNNSNIFENTKETA